MRPSDIKAIKELRRWHQNHRSGQAFPASKVTFIDPGLLGYDRGMLNLIKDVHYGKYPWLYVVFFYSTPMMFMWESKEGREFYIPSRRYSTTTTRFQNELRAFVRDNSPESKDLP